MFFKATLLISLSTGLIPSTFAHQGGMTGGGGGEVKPYDYNSSWIGGKDREVKVCYEIAPHFLSKEDIKAPLVQPDPVLEFKKAFQTLAEYAKEKKIHNEREKELHLSPTLKSFESTCKGDEDFVIFFGHDLKSAAKEKEHPLLAYARKARDRYVNPAGFSEKLRFIDDSVVLYPNYKGKHEGYIWIASQGIKGNQLPNWSMPYTLRGMLLHELGHVFGNEHYPGTIMDEGILTQMLQYSFSQGEAQVRKAQAYLTHVDFTKELYMGKGYDISLKGKLQREAPPEKQAAALEKAKVTFKRLTGHKPENPRAKLDVIWIGPIPNIILTLTDGEKVFRKHLKLSSFENIPMIEGDARTFEVTAKMKPDRAIFVASLMKSKRKYFQEHPEIDFDSQKVHEMFDPNRIKEGDKTVTIFSDVAGIVINATLKPAATLTPVTIRRNSSYHSEVAEEDSGLDNQRLVEVFYMDPEGNQHLIFTPDLPYGPYEPALK